MSKKFLSFILVMSIFLTSIPTNKVLAMDISNDMVLVNTEVFTVEDEQGNEFEIILEEYEEDSNIQSRSFVKEHPIGTKKSYVFKISNAALGIPSIIEGAPISEAIKKKMADILTDKLGEKIGASLIPGLKIASWMALAVGGINEVAGNDGFAFTVDSIYSEYFSQREGYYLYGWDLVKLSVKTY